MSLVLPSSQALQEVLATAQGTAARPPTARVRRTSIRAVKYAVRPLPHASSDDALCSVHAPALPRCIPLRDAGLHDVSLTLAALTDECQLACPHPSPVA